MLFTAAVMPQFDSSSEIYKLDGENGVLLKGGAYTRPQFMFMQLGDLIPGVYGEAGRGRGNKLRRHTQYPCVNTPHRISLHI